MAKDKTLFVCGECGYETAKWMGKCPSCNSWNTLVEAKQITGSAGPGHSSSAPAPVQ